MLSTKKFTGKQNVGGLELISPMDAWIFQSKDTSLHESDVSTNPSS